MEQTNTRAGSPNGHSALRLPNEHLAGFDAMAHFGREQAKLVNGDPQLLENYLFTLCDKDDESTALRKEIYDKSKAIKDCQDQIAAHQQVVADLNTKAEVLANERERFVNDRKREIEEKRVEIRRIRGGDYSLLGTSENPANSLAYWIAVPILLFLSIYLVLFYASVLYNAFFLDPMALVAEQSEGFDLFVAIANVEAFPQAYARYGILGALFLFSGAFVFLSLGFLLYWFAQSKQSLWTYALYLFTFLFDAFLAYEIVRKVYISEMLFMDKPDWAFGMAFGEMAFYIILMAGFGMYVAWGLLLKYVLEEYRKVLPAVAGRRRRRAEIGRLTREIKEAQQQFGHQLETVKAKAANIEQQELRFRENEIERHKAQAGALREKLRLQLKNSGLSAQELHTQVTAFYAGWCNGLREAAGPETAPAMLGQCHEHVTRFYKNMGLN